jgi:spore protease
MSLNQKNIPDNSFKRTDLAIEDIYGIVDNCCEGINKYQTAQGEICVASLAVEGSNVRKKGHYVTVSFPPISLFAEETEEAVVHIVANELKKLSKTLFDEKELFSILAVGLGNRDITADAVGPEAVGAITPTSHLAAHEISALGLRSISAITPGVTGKTGIETADMILAAVALTEPDLIIAVDALAALSCDRIGTTIQITDAGISPGAGIGNRRTSFTKDTLGVPIIAIGVPTVVNSSVLVEEAFLKAGEEIKDSLKDVLRKGRGYFVCPQDCDIITYRTASVVGKAINAAFAEY